MYWIEVTTPTPVLNTPDFQSVFGGTSGNRIPLGSCGFPESFEFVALKHMRFEVLDQIGPHILQIQWPPYSVDPLYIDQRFCRPTVLSDSPSLTQFSATTILQHMESKVGTPYVWGGNWASGVPEMLIYYPPQKPLDKPTEILWTLKGLDCSGLLFEATAGTTPRNTSHLLQYGRSLSPSESLKPLDMIIYPGHVLFVRDKHTIIESKFPFGVRICPLKLRLDEISQTRNLVLGSYLPENKNSYFTIRRFITESD